MSSPKPMMRAYKRIAPRHFKGAEPGGSRCLSITYRATHNRQFIPGRFGSGRALKPWDSVKILRLPALGSSYKLKRVGCHLAVLGVRDELEVQLLTFVQITDA